MGASPPFGLDTGGCIGIECGGDTQGPTLGFTFGSGGGGGGSGQTGGGGTGAGGGGRPSANGQSYGSSPNPTAILPGFGPASTGAVWTSPGGTEARWNPSATTPTEAMLLGSRSPVAWVDLNPHAAAFLRYSISLAATALSADLAVAVDENAPVEQRVAAGAGFLLQVLLAPEAEAGEVATEAGAAFSVGAEAAGAEGVAAGAEGGSAIVAGEGGALGPTTPDVVYHYTTAENAAKIQQTGLWTQSSATDVGTYTSQQAVELLGVKTPPEVVIELQNGGRFIPNRPPIVQPHPLGAGGGLDLTNPTRVPPRCILCVRPVR